MAELTGYVVDSFEAGHTEDIRPAFELAERLIATGPDEERHAAVVGFLETVQNVASHRKCGSTAFAFLLGPMSLRVWAELTEMWKGQPTSEPQSELRAVTANSA